MKSNFTAYCAETINNFVDNAEAYLVKVLKKNSACKTFDEFRVWTYYKPGSTSAIEDLPPTSNSIRLHILRAFFIVYSHINCLNPDTLQLNPLVFGFEEEGEFLMPAKVKALLPPISELVPSCTCKKCKKKTCICVVNKIPCCKFCGCFEGKECCNEFNFSEMQLE